VILLARKPIRLDAFCVVIVATGSFVCSFTDCFASAWSSTSIHASALTAVATITSIAIRWTDFR
jgi:hypothetical protein